MNVKNHTASILVAFILSPVMYNLCFGQENESLKNPRFIGFKLHSGFILPHSKDLRDISQSNPWGMQLDWSKLMIRDKSWNNCHCYAKAGVSLTYFNYANPDILGSSYNLIFFAEPYLTFKRRLFYSLRTGIGLTYLNKVYDQETNPTNVFYSSHLSFIIFLSLNVNYKINDHYTLIASGDYNHISNGGTRDPNKGMNFPTIAAGISYSPHPVNLRPKPKLTSKKGDTNFYANLFGTLPTVSESTVFPKKKTLLIGLSFGGMKYITNFNAFSLGMELVHDGSLKEKAERLDMDYDHNIVALMIGHNLVFGRFNFNQQFGFYIHKPTHATSKNIYQRYTLTYLLGEYITIGTSIKAHGHVAENMDVQLGVIF